MIFVFRIRGSIHLLLQKRAIEIEIEKLINSVSVHYREEVRYAVGKGHRIRPLSCLLACEATGGAWRDAIPASIAIELMHKASVIHDDLADGDDVRGGQESFHAKFGVPRAVATSDFLLALSFRHASATLQRLIGGMNLFIRTYYDMSVGQLTDVVGGTHEEPGTVQWGANHRLKTGSLSALAFEVGSVLGGGSAAETMALASFGESIGTAFQLVNDVQGLLGIDRSHMGSLSDLRCGKITPLISWARHTATRDIANELDLILSYPSPLDTDRIQRIRSILVNLGAPEYARGQARTILAEARRKLEILDDTIAKRILCDTYSSNKYMEKVF